MPLSQAVLWWLLVLLELAAVVHLWRSGLVHRFPVLTARFGAGGLFLLLLLILRNQRSPAYSAVYSMAVLFSTLLETGCIVEIFFALCGKFRKFVNIGGALLVILWVFGVGAAAAVRLAWVPAGWARTWQVVMIGARYVDLAMVLVLAGSWLLLRWPGIPIAVSASRAAGIILFHVLWGFVLSTVMIARNGQPVQLFQVLPLVGGCLTAGAALALLRFVPDEYALPPAPSREQLERDYAAAVRATDHLEETTVRFLRSLK